jgi:hypothetical protein
LQQSFKQSLRTRPPQIRRQLFRSEQQDPKLSWFDFLKLFKFGFQINAYLLALAAIAKMAAEPTNSSAASWGFASTAAVWSLLVSASRSVIAGCSLTSSQWET